MTPGVDFIGYFENITSDFNHVSKRLGLVVRLSHDNRSARKNDYRDYYTPTTRQIVADVYQKDIELLSYDFHNQGIQDLIAQRALEQT